MEVRIYKKELNRLVLFPDILSNLNDFLTKVMNVEILKNEDEYVIVDVSVDVLRKQVFNGSTWYKSIDSKFAVFKRDGYWKVVFQRK